MNGTFVLQLFVAICVAVMLIRYWKIVVATIAVFVLTLTVIGAVTVMQNLQ